MSCDCNSGCEVKSTTHFFIHYSYWIKRRRSFFSTASIIDTKVLDNTDFVLTQTLFSRLGPQDVNNNIKINTETIEFILITKKFVKSLL